MKRVLQIETIIDKPQQLDDMVEKLVLHKSNAQNSNHLVLKGWSIIDIASAEAHINGIITVNEGNEKASPLFTSPFLFSCIKNKIGEYKIEWSVCLS